MDNAIKTGNKYLLSPARLRWSLLILLLVILIPLLVLILQTQQQMKWEAFYQHRLLAEDLAQSIDGSLQQAIAREEAFGYADYQFFIPATDLQASRQAGQQAGLIQQSTLAKFPVSSELPGLIGYFQIDDQGVFTTPLLPNDGDLTRLNVAISNIRQRQDLRDELLSILSENQLVRRSRQQESRSVADLISRQRTASEMQESGVQDEEASAEGVGSDDPTTAQLTPASPIEKAEISADTRAEANSSYAADKLTTDSSVTADDDMPDTNETNVAHVTEQPVRNKPTADKTGGNNNSDSVSRLGDARAELATGSTPPRTLDQWHGNQKPAAEFNARDKPASYSQQVFDQLNQPTYDVARKPSPQPKAAPPRVEDLKISKEAFTKSKKADVAKFTEIKANRSNERSSRKEQTTTFETIAKQDASPPTDVGAALEAARPNVRVRIFESELDPFEFALLNSGEFVLFRNVWKDGKRLIQGAILNQQKMLNGTIKRFFKASALSRMSDLLVAWQGNVLASVAGVSSQLDLKAGARASATLNSSLDRRSEELSGTLLHQTRLSAPLSELEILWTINTLPAGPGARVVTWSSLTLLAVLVLGFTMIYLLGMKQIRLHRQQQDFVAAVSHELKTPLTSIRMYGEMLREGWVTEEKKCEYYDFIHDESERLSRLIANVLQLARMERNDIKLVIKPVKSTHLIDHIRSKIHTQVAKADFECQYQIAVGCEEHYVDVDIDAFSQIIINIIDNALKFAAKSDNKRIDISLLPGSRDTIVFAIRDYGPGIPASQMKKIFDLFYRPGNELTRDTIGTGIGLALVRQLSTAMGGKAEVANKAPGAEFLLILPSSKK